MWQEQAGFNKFIVLGGSGYGEDKANDRNLGVLLSFPLAVSTPVSGQESKRRNLFDSHGFGVLGQNDFQILQRVDQPKVDLEHLQPGDIIYWQNCMDGVLGGQIESLADSPSQLRFVDCVWFIPSIDGPWLTTSVMERSTGGGPNAFYASVEEAHAAHLKEVSERNVRWKEEHAAPKGSFGSY